MQECGRRGFGLALDELFFGDLEETGDLGVRCRASQLLFDAGLRLVDLTLVAVESMIAPRIRMAA